MFACVRGQIGNLAVENNFFVTMAEDRLFREGEFTEVNPSTARQGIA